MKLALTMVGAFLVASTTKFGSEAVHLDHWRAEAKPAFTQTDIAGLNFAEDQPIKVALNPVPSAEIQASLAALRAPEGPPLPPPDVPLESVCYGIAYAAEIHGIPAGFFARLIWQESRFQQRAVSPAGAQGVAQFMPAVAAERGLRNPFDALAALPQSARFLREHLDTFGNLGLAAAAYNGGARRVTDWLARRGSLPQETRDYVKIITGHDAERWTEENHIELPVHLPSRAPCEGIADLSRDAEPAKVAVQLEPQVAKIVETARIAAAKAEAAAKARLAAAKAKRDRQVAKGGGLKTKPVQTAARPAATKTASKPALPAKIAERAPTDRSAKAAKTRLAETSAAKR